MLGYLAVLAVILTRFTGDVSAVTDQEFQDQIQGLINVVDRLDSEIRELKEENKKLSSEISRQDDIIRQILTTHEDLDLVQNDTIEERVTLLETQVADLEESSADHDTRLTAAEENIQELQVTDIDLESRITALEENGGSSNNETIAFHAVLVNYTTIPDLAAVEFDEILLNQGKGYDSTTGVFIVPSGGGGLYYFSTYLLVQDGEVARFQIVLNDEDICSALGDQDDSGTDMPQMSCSSVVNVEEGDEVKVVHNGPGDTDDTPLYIVLSTYNGFNGFRI